jgi:hypothetical protein
VAGLEAGAAGEGAGQLGPIQGEAPVVREGEADLREGAVQPDMRREEASPPAVIGVEEGDERRAGEPRPVLRAAAMPGRSVRAGRIRGSCSAIACR